MRRVALSREKRATSRLNAQINWKNVHRVRRGSCSFSLFLSRHLMADCVFRQPLKRELEICREAVFVSLATRDNNFYRYRAR